ncbi:MAG: PD-(D/E)XK nuclease family protein [Pseudomonadota bacterium]
MSNTLQQEELARLDTVLAAGAQVLTPNYSSSAQLQNNWCKYALARQNSKIIETPTIAAIDLWLGKLWYELALHLDAPQLGWQVLEPAQELLLWRQVIRATDVGTFLLNIDGTAESTREALRLLQQWQITLPELHKHVRLTNSQDENPDDREIFLQWAKSFIELCQNKRVLTFSNTLHALLNLANKDAEVLASILPKKIWLWGFTDPPPIYVALFARFAELGADVRFWQAPNASPAARVVRCAHEDEECRAAVQWAVQTLKSNPDAAIGIICADPQAMAPKLDRMFAQMFPPDVPGLAYSCPVTRNLASQPFIASALQMMKLEQDHCDTLLLCQLLRSPWLRGAEQEADARAAMELQLRRRGELVTSMAGFREMCLQSGHPWYSPMLGAALLKLLQRKKPAKSSTNSTFFLKWWQEQWLLLLDEERLVATGNRALVRAWHKLQADMQKLVSLFAPGTLQEAQAIFKRLSQETHHAIINTSAPIQVTGPLASTGMRFTHVWCMQMTEQHWPSSEQHSPWLPLGLQKEARLPGSDPALALQKARSLLQQIMTSTQFEIVFSHALQADETPVRPSALLPQGLPFHVPELEMPGLHPAVKNFTNVLELLHDTSALPLPTELQHSGSSAVLADQAACPFRAFAKHRLKVKELPELSYGLSPSAVGECIHNALQNFWQVMQSSMQLHAADEDELATHISAAVISALLTVARRYPQTMTPRYHALEHERLCKLLVGWMQAEKSRGHFSVLANEEKLAWRFANLTLNLRIDRIDRNEDGSLTVVDYKTGQKTSQLWQEERPEKPQLLLYQTAVDAQQKYGPTTALLYAHINLKEQVYVGIGDSDQALPGIAFSAQKSVVLPSWELLKHHWTDSLQQLAQEYLDGRLVVDPLSRTTCDNCHLDSFCRIAERRLFR